MCRRRRAGQFWSAAADQRGVGGKNIFFKGSRKKCSFYPKHFLMTFFESSIENCNQIGTQQKCRRRRADKLSAAARRSTKVGGANKLSAARCGRRRVLCGTRPPPTPRLRAHPLQDILYRVAMCHRQCAY